MKWKILTAFALATIVCQCAPQAMAQAVTQTIACDPCALTPDVYAVYQGLNPAGRKGVEIEYERPSGKTVTVHSNNGGVFNWTGKEDYFFQQRSSSSNTKDFISFCLEINQTVQNNNKDKPGAFDEFEAWDLEKAPWQKDNMANDTVVKPMEAAAASELQKLWGFKMPDLLAVDFANKIDVAAMQLAIWEIVSDAGKNFNLFKGRLQVTSPGDYGTAPRSAAEKIVFRARKFYNDSQTYNGPLPNLVALSNPCYQDQLVALVPEPTSMLAWCIMGCVALLGSRRLRRRKA